MKIRFALLRKISKFTLLYIPCNTFYKNYRNSKLIQNLGGKNALTCVTVVDLGGVSVRPWLLLLAETDWSRWGVGVAGIR